MKVLAINSSPRKEGESKTALMLKHLVKGMQEAKAEVEVVNLRQKKINYCIGCSVCWVRTPGRCIFKDDMTNELLPKFIASDLAVIATPLYQWIMNANLKAFFERTKPADLPYLITTPDGVTRHPMRTRYPAVVLLSVCASYDDGNYFNSLSTWMKMLFHRTLIAEIYRPEAETMVTPVFSEQLADILEAAEQAGRELITSLHISPEVMARLRQPLADSFDSVYSIANLIWQTCIDNDVLPTEMLKKDIMPDFEAMERINKEVNKSPAFPRPESAEQFRTFLKMKFKPEPEGKSKATVQFVFTGDVEGACYFAIENGTLKTVMGKADNPDMTIEAPFDMWMDIQMGKEDAQEMLSQQKYHASGDLSLMKQMQEMFA